MLGWEEKFTFYSEIFSTTMFKKSCKENDCQMSRARRKEKGGDSGQKANRRTPTSKKESSTNSVDSVNTGWFGLKNLCVELS